MGEFQVTRGEIRTGKSWDVATGQEHQFALTPPTLRVIEMEDVNFHHNSAVMMPDYGVTADGTVEDTDNDASGNGDQVELAGLAAIAAALRYAKCEPDFQLLIAGHTDTSGDPTYNLGLSRLRAAAAHAVMCNQRTDWVDVCIEKSKVEDIQQILKWVAQTLGWPCDPGAVDNIKGSQTTQAVEGFQASYNTWEDGSKKDASISVDGIVGRQTWGAVFDIYQDTLEVLFGAEEEAALDEYRQALTWLDDAKPFIGCGEHKPIEEAENSNYRSETNRRVEFLFFAPDDLPTVPLVCHSSAAACDPDACEIYWKYRRLYMPVDPCVIARSAYRLTLRLGDIEDLFPTAPGTAAGRMARLQVVGLFYFPIAHAQATNAFNGLAATAANAATGHPGDQAFAGAWSYFQSDIVPGKTAAAPATDAEADQELQTQLEQFVLDQGTLPEAVADGATPTAATHFRKLRFPGGFTFVDAIGGGLDSNRDATYSMTMTGDQFAVEDLYYRDNPVLGKIPLVATLEAKDRRTGEFEPVDDATVYFQLVPTDALPAYAPAQAANAQVNRPALRGSHAGGNAGAAIPASPPLPAVPAEPAIAPQAAGVGPLLRYTTEEARNADATDPQGTNCHTDRGGKRGTGSTADGTDVAGVLFETASRAGFNAAHPDRDLGHEPYPVAAAVTPDGDSHKHAVMAQTNAEGEAGVIFMPSRMGGDTYKLRVYLGPPTLAGDGTEDGAVKQDTGTLVVWRNLHLSRYFQVTPGNPHATLLAEVNNGATYNITSNNRYRRRVSVENTPPLNTPNWSPVEGSPPQNFTGAIVMWARAWCEFVIDRNALPGGQPIQLTAAGYATARRQALADGIGGGSPYNLPNLLYLEAGAPALTPTTGLACVPMRTAESYNAMATTTAAQRIPIRVNGAGNPLFGANAAHRRRVSNLHLRFLLRGFTRSLTQNGYRPGFTVIQSAMGCTWQIIGQNGDFSGIATNYRGGHLWYGTSAYINAVATIPPGNFPYSYDSNMTHEMGHCHYREHGPGRNPGRRPAGGNDTAKHDRIQTSVCVMSYKSSEGDLCGMCSMGLRGWDIRPMTP